MILDPRRGVVIRPMAVTDDDIIYSKSFSEARGRWGMKVWRDKWAAAKAAYDYDAMDRLDREYELVGLP